MNINETGDAETFALIKHPSKNSEISIMDIKSNKVVEEKSSTPTHAKVKKSTNVLFKTGKEGRKTSTKVGNKRGSSPFILLIYLRTGRLLYK